MPLLNTTLLCPLFFSVSQLTSESDFEHCCFCFFSFFPVFFFNLLLWVIKREERKKIG